jgi:PmbA protein
MSQSLADLTHKLLEAARAAGADAADALSRQGS